MGAYPAQRIKHRHACFERHFEIVVAGLFVGSAATHVQNRLLADRIRHRWLLPRPIEPAASNALPDPRRVAPAPGSSAAIHRAPESLRADARPGSLLSRARK